MDTSATTPVWIVAVCAVLLAAILVMALVYLAATTFPRRSAALSHWLSPAIGRCGSQWTQSTAVQKQHCRQKVLDELQHNVRYNSPDSVSVALSSVQPRSCRRQTLPAISLCEPVPTLLSSGACGLPPASAPAMYGNIELIRSSCRMGRRFSELGPTTTSSVASSLSSSPSSSWSSGGGGGGGGASAVTVEQRTRKISLDSQTLTRICEESLELYETETYQAHLGQARRKFSCPQQHFPLLTPGDSYQDNRASRGSMCSMLIDDSSLATETGGSATAALAGLDMAAGNSPPMGCGLGRLHFSLHLTSNQLRVTIVRASYLRTGQARQMAYVYVKAALLPAETCQQEYRTPCVSSMGSPIFNHSVTFTLASADHTELPGVMATAPDTAASDTNSHLQLQLTVKEARKLDSNRVIGYVWVDLSLYLKKQLTGDPDCESDVLLSQEMSREIFGENKLYRRRGDVLVNLKVLETNRTDSVDIEIHVAEARNLHGKSQNASMYIRASLLVRHKVIHTKKGQSAKQGLSSPSFNDRFRFSVPLQPGSHGHQDGGGSQGGGAVSLAEEVGVLLCFCGRSRMMRVSHLLGRCALGGQSYTEGDGLLQWMEAVGRPGVRVSQWLSLS